MVVAIWLRSGGALAAYLMLFVGALYAHSGRRFSRQEAVSRHVAVHTGQTLHAVARK